MKFETLSGSLYEVDKARKVIRRLSGVKDPTPRQGADGVWKRYEAISIEVGQNGSILWDHTTPPLPETAEALAEAGGGFCLPATITNVIVAIHEDDSN